MPEATPYEQGFPDLSDGHVQRASDAYSRCGEGLKEVPYGEEISALSNPGSHTPLSGVIDLKKAFDKVNIYGLLGILQERKTNVKIINVLENWLAKCHSSTRWLSSNSQFHPFFSGVRQGGILSPLLFNLFVDVVLKKLEESKLGCFIKLNCCNSFMYSDDLILLSTSISDLQSMLNLCASVFNEIDLPINTNKSHCIRIGPRCNYQCCELSLQGVSLHWENSIKFLGVTIRRATTFQCCWSVHKHNFFASTNTIIGRLGTSAPIHIILKLVNSHGLQNLLYGTAAVSLTKAELNNLCFTYNSVFAKIFKTADQNTISLCQYYCGTLPFNLLFELQRYKFLSKLLLQGRLSRVSSIDITDISDLTMYELKYDFKLSDSITVLKRKVWAVFNSMINPIL